MAVSSLTNIKYLQQEIFKKQRLRSVSVFLSPPQRQFAFTLKKFALDFKYDQRSRRARSPSVSLRCLYLQSSAIINLLYSDLTQLSELTQHKYTKSLRSRISCERVISICYPKIKNAAQMKIVIFIM